MKIGIWAEGADDCAFFPPLIQRQLAIPDIEFLIRNRRGRCIVGITVGLKEILFDFEDCSRVLLAADNHRAAPGKAAQMKSKAIDIVGARCLVAISVQSIEAWLLADYVTLSHVMGVPNISKPPSVEGIPFPKEYLIDTIGRHPNADQLAQMATTMQLDLARRESRSLDRFLADIAAWK